MIKLSNYFFFKIKILTSYLKGWYWQVILPLCPYLQNEISEAKEL